MVESNSRIQVASLSSHLDRLQKRKSLAADFGSEDTDKHDYWFAIAGLTSDFDRHAISPIATIRRLAQSPNIFEIANAINEKHLLEAVSRYSPALTHEMGVSRLSAEDGPERILTLAWWLISAIRLHSRCDFLVPCASSAPWSHFPILSPDATKVFLIEDQPTSRRFDSTTSLSTKTLDWVSSHLISFATLIEDPRFRLAADAACTHAQQQSLRSAVSLLWSGIEALIGITHELRFRTSLLIAVFLKSTGVERKALYERMKALYDFRSKIVHGSPASDGEVLEHIVEVRELIFEMLIQITEAGNLPTTRQYEDLIFSR